MAMQCFKLFVNLKQKHRTSHHRNRQEPNLQNWQWSHLPRQFQEVPFVVQIQNLEKWCGTVYLSLNVQFPYNLITGNGKNCTYTNAPYCMICLLMENWVKHNSTCIKRTNQSWKSNFSVLQSTAQFHHSDSSTIFRADDARPVLLGEFYGWEHGL